MKKTMKIDLASVEKAFPVLDEQEQRGVVGGKLPPTRFEFPTGDMVGGGGGYVGHFDIMDGTITNWQYGNDRFAVFSGHDGTVLLLEGVHVKGQLPLQYSNTACYFNNTIWVGSKYDTFNFDDLTHEYGHYLQEQGMSQWEYFKGAFGSAWNIFIKGGEGHMDMPFEVGATNNGDSYGNQYRSKE